MKLDQVPDSILSPFFQIFLSSECEVLIGLFSSSQDYCIHPHNCCLQKVVRNFFFFGIGKTGWKSDGFLILICISVGEDKRFSSPASGALFQISSDTLEVLDFLVGTSGPCGLLLLQTEAKMVCGAIFCHRILPASCYFLPRGKKWECGEMHKDSCPLTADGILFDFIRCKVSRALPGLPHAILSQPNSAHPLPIHFFIL